MDESLPAHRDAPAGSSRESAPESRVKVKSDSDKHTIYTHFPKDKDYEICTRTKITRTLARKALTQTYLAPKILKIWYQQITKFSVETVNLEIIIDMQSWFKILTSERIQSYPWDFSRNREELTKVLGVDVEFKSHLHCKVPGVWKSLWRFFVKSLYVNHSRICRRFNRRLLEALAQNSTNLIHTHTSFYCRLTLSR